MDTPDISEAVIYTPWLSRHQAVVDRALSLSRDQRSILARAVFYPRVDNLQREKTSCAAWSRSKKKQEKNQTFRVPEDGK